MIPIIKEVDPASEIPTPQLKKRSFGIEPGTLRGQRRELSPPIDTDAEIRAQVKAMDGPTMQKWLRVKGNKEKLEQALANKRK